MTNVAIYYKMASLQDSKEVIKEIQKKISTIDGIIIGVYIDSYNENENFNLVVNEKLSSIDILYINKFLEDDFEQQLINQLARANGFKVVYFT